MEEETLRDGIRNDLIKSKLYKKLTKMFAAIEKHSSSIYNVSIRFSTKDMDPHVTVVKDVDQTFKNIVIKGRK